MKASRLHGQPAKQLPFSNSPCSAACQSVQLPYLCVPDRVWRSRGVSCSMVSGLTSCRCRCWCGLKPFRACQQASACLDLHLGMQLRKGGAEKWVSAVGCRSAMWRHWRTPLQCLTCQSPPLRMPAVCLSQYPPLSLSLCLLCLSGCLPVSLSLTVLARPAVHLGQAAYMATAATHTLCEQWAATQLRIDVSP
jgi:hypothetical protein